MADITYMPYAQRAAEIERQRKLAELLQQQYAEPIQQQTVGGFVVPTSPWQTVAKLAQAGLGAYMQGKADKSASELKQQQKTEATEFGKNFMSAMGPQKVYESTEAPKVETRPLEYTDFQNEAEYEAYRNSPDYLKTQMVQPTQFNDITGQNEPIYNFKETTKPGMSRQEAMAMLLQNMDSDNEYMQNMVKGLSGMLPAEANIGAVDPSDWTPASLAKYKISNDFNDLVPKEGTKTSNIGAVNPADWTPESLANYAITNDFNDLVPKVDTKTPNLQRFSKTYIGAGGKEYTQDAVFDPGSGTSTNVGDPYVSKAAPTGNASSSIQAGATLRSEYNNNPIIKRHAVISSAYENILNNQETGAGDMALIFQYMKMLDPDSAVREGEYASAENSGSVPQSVRNVYNRAIDGQRLQPEQRNAFINQAQGIYQTSAQQAEVVRRGIERIGQETGVNPRLYTLPEPKSRNPKGTDGNYGTPPTGAVKKR